MILWEARRFLVSNVLNSALPPQRLRPDTRPEHRDPVSHTAWKKKGKKKKEKERNIKNNFKILLIIKIKKEKSNQTNKQIHQ